MTEQDIQDTYEEDAARLEFCEGLTRENAEALAWKHILEYYGVET